MLGKRKDGCHEVTGNPGEKVSQRIKSLLLIRGQELSKGSSRGARPGRRGSHVWDSTVSADRRLGVRRAPFESHLEVGPVVV